MPKFTQTFNKMLDDHADKFQEFRAVHDQYKLDTKKYQSEYNRIGKPILDIIREYENRLCSGMERGVFGKYSDKVSEKFWDRVKKEFPLVELIGVEIQ